jgi:hypothetical protein
MSGRIFGRVRKLSQVAKKAGIHFIDSAGRVYDQRISIMRVLTLLVILSSCIVAAQGQAPAPPLSQSKTDVTMEHITFKTEDGGLIYADVYGKSDKGVVLAHGGQFT